MKLYSKVLLHLLLVVLIFVSGAAWCAQNGNAGTIDACLAQPDGSTVTLTCQQVMWRGKSGRSFAIKEWSEKYPARPRLLVVSTVDLPVKEMWSVDIIGTLGTMLEQRPGEMPLQQRVLQVWPQNVKVYCDVEGKPGPLMPVTEPGSDTVPKRTLTELGYQGATAMLYNMLPELPDQPDSLPMPQTMITLAGREYDSSLFFHAQPGDISSDVSGPVDETAQVETNARASGGETTASDWRAAASDNMVLTEGGDPYPICIPACNDIYGPPEFWIREPFDGRLFYCPYLPDMNASGTLEAFLDDLDKDGGFGFTLPSFQGSTYRPLPDFSSIDDNAIGCVCITYSQGWNDSHVTVTPGRKRVNGHYSLGHYMCIGGYLHPVYFEQWWLQKEPAPWANDPYGNPRTVSGVKMKQKGCCVTCAAMQLTGWGFYITPGELNAVLRARSDGYAGESVNWSAIEKYTKEEGYPFRMRRGTPTKEALLRGMSVQTKLSHRGHWVVPYQWYNGDDTYVIYDPMGRTTFSTGGYGELKESDTRMLYPRGFSSTPVAQSATVPTPDKSELRSYGSSACVAWSQDASVVLRLRQGAGVVAESEIEYTENDETGEETADEALLNLGDLQSGNYTLDIVGTPGQPYDVTLWTYSFDSDQVVDQIYTGIMPSEGVVHVEFQHESPYYLRDIAALDQPGQVKCPTSITAFIGDSCYLAQSSYVGVRPIIVESATPLSQFSQYYLEGNWTGERLIVSSATLVEEGTVTCQPVYQCGSSEEPMYSRIIGSDGMLWTGVSWNGGFIVHKVGEIGE